MSALSNIIRNIKAIMEARGVTQAELSRRTGINGPQVNGYLSGKNAPGIEVLERIAKALGVEMVDLVAATEPKLLPVAVSPIEETRLALLRIVLDAGPARIETLAGFLGDLLPASNKKQPKSTG